MDWSRGFRKWAPGALPILIAVGVAPFTEGVLKVIIIAACVGVALVYLVLESRAAPEGTEGPLPSVVRNRVIDPAKSAPVIHGRRFAHCEIRGHIHIVGGHIEHSKWVRGTFQVVADPTLNLPADTLSFIDCGFHRCEFSGCTLVGSAQEIANLQQVFGAR
jgi:hypothetical protein